MSEKKLISIITPVLNEEKNIRRCYEEITAITAALAGEYDFEFIFTDNCSTDSSFALLEQLAKEDSRVRAYRFSKNFGYQRSIWTGYQQAKGDAAIELDCDLQDPPAMLPEFLMHWRKGYKIVYGVREERKESRVVTALRKIFYRLINLISADDLPVDAGDFMLLDRVILDQLAKVKDPHIYIRGTVFSFGFPRVGIPYKRQERLLGESKFPLHKMLFLASDGIVSQSTVPLRLSLFLGLGLTFVTSLLVLVYFFLWVFGAESLPSGFTTLVLLMLVSMSFNGICIGILGEYLGRLYKIVQQPPMTIIEKSARDE